MAPGWGTGRVLLEANSPDDGQDPAGE